MTRREALSLYGVTLAVSTALQYIASFLALRLISKTRRLTAWVLIASACLLMAIRRTISLVALVQGDAGVGADSAVELVALVISILMVLGIASIGGHFEEVERAAEERRSFEEKLLESQRLESLGMLSGGIAHDFNNILTCVLGNAEAIREQLGVKHPAEPALRGIIEASERAAGVTRHLLAYSGRGRFDIRALDLSRELKEIERLAAGSLTPNCQLSWVFGSGPCVIEGDEAQIQQLVMHLIVNAVESIGESTGHVVVSTDRVGRDDVGLREALAEFGKEPSHDSYVCLRVADDGCGMDELTLSKMFDPFFSSKAPGRGLGLSAVLGIVRGHDGATHVSSEIAVGTVCTVWFPASVGATEQKELRSDDFDDPRGPGDSTILVVDDEDDVRITVARLLAHHGYRVVDASSGDAAVARHSEVGRSIDLAVVDLTMPGMNGRETIEGLRDQNPSLPAIIISGFDVSDVNLAEMPGVRFLHKPFRQADLLNLIGSMLEDSEATHE